MFCVVQFYLEMHDDLYLERIGIKVVAIKLVIALSFYQTFVLQIATSDTVHWITTGPHLAYPDEKIILPHLLLCLEMAIFSLLHLSAFPVDEYRAPPKQPAQKEKVEAEEPADPRPKHSNPFMAVGHAFVRLGKGIFNGVIWLVVKIFVVLWKGLCVLAKTGLVFLMAMNPWDIIKAFGRGIKWLFVGVWSRNDEKPVSDGHLENGMPPDDGYDDPDAAFPTIGGALHGAFRERHPYEAETDHDEGKRLIESEQVGSRVRAPAPGVASGSSVSRPPVQITIDTSHISNNANTNPYATNPDTNPYDNHATNNPYADEPYEMVSIPSVKSSSAETSPSRVEPPRSEPSRSADLPRSPTIGKLIKSSVGPSVAPSSPTSSSSSSSRVDRLFPSSKAGSARSRSPTSPGKDKKTSTANTEGEKKSRRRSFLGRSKSPGADSA
jgi:hypothetical protein